MLRLAEVYRAGVFVLYLTRFQLLLSFNHAFDPDLKPSQIDLLFEHLIWSVFPHLESGFPLNFGVLAKVERLLDLPCIVYGLLEEL